MASKTWIVGTPEQARDTLLEMQAELGLEALVIFPHLPGMQRPETLEQLGRFWAEVRPSLTASASTSPPRRRAGDTPEEGKAAEECRGEPRPAQCEGFTDKCVRKQSSR